ncbi:MAG: metal ABC transporter permease [Hyphomicrobiaceae bacterium]
MILLTTTATDAGWPDVAQAVEVLALGGGYNTSLVMIGVALYGLAAGVVGSFAVLRRRAMMSDTLSHATLPGIALAFIVATALGGEGRSLPVLLAGAALAGVAGVGAVHVMSRYTRLPEDAAMGAVLSVFFGLGFVLLSYIQTLGTGAEGGIQKFIYGQTAAMSTADAILIGVVGTVSLLAVAALFKELRLVCFDPQFADVQGWPVGAIDLALMALVVVVTVIGLQAVGLILVIALIVIPPATARLWTDRLGRMVALAAAFGAVSGYTGAALSALMPRFPAGGVIVLVAGALFFASFLLSPRHGLLSGALRHLRLSLDIESQHVLRRVFETAESGVNTVGMDTFPLSRLALTRAWSAPRRRAVIAHLTWLGLVRAADGEHVLTKAGVAEAQRLTRNHRLWELFLINNADLAPSHVHRSADLVEHVLDGEIVRRLEEELARSGRLPGNRSVPMSAHPV